MTPVYLIAMHCCQHDRHVVKNVGYRVQIHVWSFFFLFAD